MDDLTALAQIHNTLSGLFDMLGALNPAISAVFDGAFTDDFIDDMVLAYRTERG